MSFPAKSTNQKNLELRQQVDELNELKRQIENKKMQFKQLSKNKSLSSLTNQKSSQLNSTRKNNQKEFNSKSKNQNSQTKESQERDHLKTDRAQFQNKVNTINQNIQILQSLATSLSNKSSLLTTSRYNHHKNIVNDHQYFSNQNHSKEKINSFKNDNEFKENVNFDNIALKQSDLKSSEPIETSFEKQQLQINKSQSSVMQVQRSVYQTNQLNQRLRDELKQSQELIKIKDNELRKYIYENESLSVEINGQKKQILEMEQSLQVYRDNFQLIKSQMNQHKVMSDIKSVCIDKGCQYDFMPNDQQQINSDVKDLFQQLRTDNEQMAKELRRLEKLNRELRDKIFQIKGERKEQKGVIAGLQQAMQQMLKMQSSISLRDKEQYAINNNRIFLNDKDLNNQTVQTQSILHQYQSAQDFDLGSRRSSVQDPGLMTVSQFQQTNSSQQLKSTQNLKQQLNASQNINLQNQVYQAGQSRNVQSNIRGNDPLAQFLQEANIQDAYQSQMSLDINGIQDTNQSLKKPQILNSKRGTTCKPFQNHFIQNDISSKTQVLNQLLKLPPTASSARSRSQINLTKNNKAQCSILNRSSSGFEQNSQNENKNYKTFQNDTIQINQLEKKHQSQQLLMNQTQQSSRQNIKEYTKSLKGEINFVDEEIKILENTVMEGFQNFS